MVTQTKTRARRAVEAEFLPADEAERRAQNIAAQSMMQIPEPEYAEPEPQEPEPDDIALQTVLSELGADGTSAKVNVYQLDSMKNKAFVGAFMPTEFSLENVQKQYGPGDYEIRVYDIRGLKTRRIIKIAEPKKQQEIIVYNPAMETGKIIETMQAGFAQMGNMFAQALGQLANNQPKPKSTLETLREMQMMKDVMGLNSQPQQTDPMRVLEIATGLAEKITPRVGEPGTGEVILEAIKNFGPMLMSGMQQQAQIPRSQIPALIQNPIPQPMQQNPVNPENQPTTESDEMNLMKKYYLALLIKQAEANNEPMTYANMMLDVIGDDKALELVNAQNWFELLCAEEPRAAKYRPWFEDMRSCILDLTKPETDDKTDIQATTVPENVPIGN